jgi:hypothetical protein
MIWIAPSTCRVSSVVRAGVGHFLAVEASEAFGAIVCDFLRAG